MGFTDKALSLTSGITSHHFACLLHLLEELRELVRYLYLNVDVDLGLLSTTGRPTAAWALASATGVPGDDATDDDPPDAVETSSSAMEAAAAKADVSQGPP